MKEQIEKPERVLSYFKVEIVPLLIITVSGICYNIGMTAGPYFEGRLAGRLFEIMEGKKTVFDMVTLALTYVLVILFVQFMRYIKRFYVRRFANDTNRNMRHMLYNSLVHKSKKDLEKESVGALMTKAISDVDACVEGMRKFTTEVFDTGIVLIAYAVMLLVYDWRLTLLSCLFVPIAYLVAERLKKVIYRFTAAYKESAGNLNDATLDRVSNAMTYRIFGREEDRNQAYEKHLKDYERKAVKANIWETSMQPIYNCISMTGAIFILYFGGKNVAGTGWTSWDIAAFTTFLACFVKLSLKSSKAAKLFNAVQKAQVSWRRIKPLMEPYQMAEVGSRKSNKEDVLCVSHVSYTYPGGPTILRDLSFTAHRGEVIGVTGPIASGKSTLGKVFLCENSYRGSITYGGKELAEMTEKQRSQIISYMGHEPELMSDTIEENIRLGEDKEIDSVLKTVYLDEEVKTMEQGKQTCIGSGGIRLSGGQQARVSLARTLYQDGEILILDDPFSAVDKKTEQTIMKQIKEVYKDRIIMILSHRLSLFPEFDQVIWMENGEEQVSTHAALLKHNEMYAKLYELQEAGGDLDER